jgi:hypothetical protein
MQYFKNISIARNVYIIIKLIFKMRFNHAKKKITLYLKRSFMITTFNQDKVIKAIQIV